MSIHHIDNHPLQTLYRECNINFTSLQKNTLVVQENSLLKINQTHFFIKNSNLISYYIGFYEYKLVSYLTVSVNYLRFNQSFYLYVVIRIVYNVNNMVEEYYEL